jgi:hypothetical protein
VGVICEGGQIVKSALLPLKVLAVATSVTLPPSTDVSFKARFGESMATVRLADDYRSKRA